MLASTYRTGSSWTWEILSTDGQVVDRGTGPDQDSAALTARMAASPR